MRLWIEPSGSSRHRIPTSGTYRFGGPQTAKLRAGTFVRGSRTGEARPVPGQKRTRWGDHRVRVQPRSWRLRRWILHHKGGCHRPAPAATAAGVPRHFLIGALDEPYRRDNITAVFEAGRAAGALWALSTDPLQHGPIVDFDLMFDSIDAVLAARFSPTPGAPLRAVAVTDGWLGDRSSGAISPYACFSSNRASARWLPSPETAFDWQRMAKGSAVVGGC